MSHLVGTPSLESLQSFGKSEMEHTDGRGLRHKFMVDGLLTWDRTSATLRSKQLKSGSQVLYSLGEVAIASDNISIDGIFDRESFAPRAVDFSGNLKMQAYGTDYPFQTAVADKMTYNLEDGILSCWGTNDHPLLFWRESDRLTMEADHLTLSSDLQVIEGLGRVRCRFDESEQKLFKKVFGK